ncbi:MAG: carbon starvation protein A [Verrucomicrobia bacterium]|nr:carbon starvation protein A [Verrucomicrobiota bacterium]
MLLAIFVAACVLFGLGYRFYGGFVERRLEVNKEEQTPAHTMRDGVDYDPAPELVLFGHHFSAIAGSGPIVGPVVAGLAFGWGPALLWILIGCIFMGSVYDYSSLIASVRNQGKSLGEIARDFLGGFSYKIFLAFLMIVLFYILIVFVDLTAATFAPPVKEAEAQGGVVSMASLIYIGLAVAFGLALKRSGLSAGKLSIVFVPLVFVAIWVSLYIPLMPETVAAKTGMNPHFVWTVVLLIYCAVASVLPVWILLQPRDFLSSFLLYACLAAGFVGLVAAGITGKYSIQYPVFCGYNNPELGPIFPILFVTIACGAISGFHGLVATGTTSKQLSKISEARPIAYGGMLMEGVLAVLSLATVMILLKDPEMPPTTLFASGLGSFVSSLGINPTVVSAFALLAVSTFLLTTLDAGTRLTRFIVQELFNVSNTLLNRTICSFAIVAVPAIAIFLAPKDMPLWKLIWPAFGATNQLLAALGLFFLFLWRRKSGKSTLFISIPMVIMFVITVTAMVQLVVKSCVTNSNWAVGAVCGLLLVMTLAILFDALRKMFQGNPKGKN